MVLLFNLQLLMLKSRHGWSDTSFNDLLCMLADTYPEGNKVPANAYRAKRMIRPVAMKLKKFHACTNHYILYQGKYKNLQSYPQCGASRYKNNAGCRADVDVEGPKTRPSRSHFLRMRRKRATCRGKVLHCQCGTCMWSIAFVRYSGTLPNSLRSLVTRQEISGLH